MIRNFKIEFYKNFVLEWRLKIIVENNKDTINIKRIKSDYLLFVMPVIYVVVAVIVVMLVSANGNYPTGSDTMYHIYRGDYVYNSIKNGNWYPVYNSMWYNGVELMRYWAPLGAYFMAFCQMLAGGSQISGYLIFVGLIFFFGAISWLFIGRAINRPYLGAFIGILWFFMPNNLLALFVEGNLARSLCMVFLPIFIYAVCEYLKEQRVKYIPIIIVSFALMILCHLGYAGMIALAVLIYCIVYIIQGGNKKAVVDIIVTILISFLILGIWVFASLNGGITSLDNSENMSRFFQSILISINPFERIESNNSNFYFGLAATLLSVYGIFFGYKKSRTGFIAGMIILIFTTTAMYPVLKILPGSQYLWMLRFISIALCMILYSFLMWDTLKKPFVIIFCVLLVADTIPSLSVIYNKAEATGTKAEDRFDAMQEATLIKKGQEITNQRLALMDESSLGARGAWLVADWNNATPATFGAGWEAANTSTNIARLNKALANSKYYYMFDRCLELGNDTVLVKLSQLERYSDAIIDLDKAASKVGYSLVEQNAGYRMYHIDQQGNWGTQTKYQAIGIGSGAVNISLQFPAVEETDSNNLNDYTFEQLSQYKEIFLDGFTYNDRETAEELILKLSEAGVRIIIYADGIPQDKNHSQTFLGVTCNAITFNNGYPEMDTRIGKIYADMFPQGHTTWETVYLEGLDNTWGTISDNGFDLDFYGTVKNDNIIMTGLNLTYFYSLTNDKTIGKLLENMTTLTADTLPERKIIPLEIKYESDAITITADIDSVNTSLSYHDIFKSSQYIEKKNNLMYVNAGTTYIKLEVPYLWQGAVVSIIGLVLSVIWVMRLRKRNMAQPVENGEKSENI